MKNKKGFTLVELLAVIVILAVVILIAVTAVIPRMNNAKKNAFVDEAQAYVKAAQEAAVAYQVDNPGGSAPTCVKVSYLNGNYIEKKGTAYTGYITLNGSNATINLSSSKYTIDGKAANGLKPSDVENYKSSFTTAMPNDCYPTE